MTLSPDLKCCVADCWNGESPSAALSDEDMIAENSPVWRLPDG